MAGQIAESKKRDELDAKTLRVVSALEVLPVNEEMQEWLRLKVVVECLRTAGCLRGLPL